MNVVITKATIDTVNTSSNHSTVEVEMSGFTDASAYKEILKSMSTHGYLQFGVGITAEIKDVKFYDKTTVVFWSDGTKTHVVMQDGDSYNKELGLAMCICKKVYGNKGNYNNIFKKWIYDKEKVQSQKSI